MNKPTTLLCHPTSRQNGSSQLYREFEASQGDPCWASTMGMLEGGHLDAVGPVLGRVRRNCQQSTVVNTHSAPSWLAWSCDAINFFSISLSMTNLETVFSISAHTITTSITPTLLLRSVGADTFGVISDRFGRKWPLVFDLMLCSVIELGSGFVKTYPQFLAVRSLFGGAMSGIWGLSAVSALENLPVELRGLASGVLQQSYAAGYLITNDASRKIPHPDWTNIDVFFNLVELPKLSQTFFPA